MWHVGWNFARREPELAVQQLVDVTQGVGKSVAELPDGGRRIGVIGQLVLQALLFLQMHWKKKIQNKRE